jgi:hypothetical protein
VELEPGGTAAVGGARIAVEVVGCATGAELGPLSIAAGETREAGSGMVAGGAGLAAATGEAR